MKCGAVSVRATIAATFSEKIFTDRSGRWVMLKDRRIHVNAVSPGLTETAGRIGQPDDIAKACCSSPRTMPPTSTASTYSSTAARRRSDLRFRCRKPGRPNAGRAGTRCPTYRHCSGL